METPSFSKGGVTRSQHLAASIDTGKVENCEKSVSKAKAREHQEDGYALMDITNDSPIVGLANGGNLKTPMPKPKRSRVKNTPGSGEALLRCQVKTLLQKVEEGTHFSTFSLQTMHQIQSLFGLASTNSSVFLQQPSVPQVVNKNTLEGKIEESPIRSLFLDFSDKSQHCDASEKCSSEPSYEKVLEGVSRCYVEKPKVTTEEDDASLCSMQVNPITQDENDDGEEIIEEDEKDYY